MQLKSVQLQKNKYRTVSVKFSRYQEIITIESGKRGGKPSIRGMRITMGDVLGWLSIGMTHQEILTDFPELTEEDILACLAFVADRQNKARVVAG